MSLKIQRAVVALATSAVLWSAPALAQDRHVIDPSLMRHAIAEQLAVDQQHRAALIGALRRPDVRQLADQLGLNVIRAEGAVATLSSAELARMAAPLNTAGADLSGGSNVVVISTTTVLLLVIIIILLVQ